MSQNRPPRSLLILHRDCKLGPETLYTLVEYVEAPADARSEAGDGDAGETDDGGPVLDERGDQLPEDVPSKPSLAQKESNDKRYWYYRWRGAIR